MGTCSLPVNTQMSHDVTLSLRRAPKAPQSRSAALAALWRFRSRTLRKLRGYQMTESLVVPPSRFQTSPRVRLASIPNPAPPKEKHPVVVHTQWWCVAPGFPRKANILVVADQIEVRTRMTTPRSAYGDSARLLKAPVQERDWTLSVRPAGARQRDETRPLCGRSPTGRK